MSNTPKTYSVIAVALIVACLAAGYFLMTSFLPSYNQSKDFYTLAQSNNTRLKQVLASVQTFLGDYKQQSADATLAQQALPAGTPDTPNFLSSLSQLASASGVALSDFQITPSTSNSSDPTFAPSSYTIQPEDLSVTASGSFASFKDFISRIEAHLRLIDITHVSVSAGNSSVKSSPSGDPILQFQIKIRTYYQE